jgi:hypothetical protein
MEVFDLAEGVIIDHDRASQIGAKTALISRGVSSPSTGLLDLRLGSGSKSKAKTW